MCFSAEISFTAAAALIVMGTATLRNFSNKNFFFLAAIPLLFGFQQLSEGILWTEIGHGHQNGFIYDMAARSFLVFAFFIWPIWIPLALLMVEKISWRRQVIFFIFAAGVALSLTNVYFALDQKVTVNIMNHSIQYTGNIPSQTYIYPLIVVSPIFISSMNRVWLFGAFITVAYFVTSYLYEETFVSVWCFLAAVVSVILYKVLKDNAIEARVEAMAKEKAGEK